MLDSVRKALRISSNHFDDELQDLIDAAKADLALSGISPDKVPEEGQVSDPLIRRAITTYVKAHFGLDNPDSEKYQQSYNMLKQHLTLSSEYTGGDTDAV